MFLGNALSVPEFKSIIWTGRPRQYRSDCQLGQFKIGSSQLVGKSLEMEVFGFRTFDDELFGYGFQTWLQVLFIDPQNVVSSCLFKTESLDNFANLQVNLAAEGKAIGEGIVTATMAKRSASSGKSYFAVEFEWNARNDDGKRLMEIAAFVGTLNPNQFALPGSVSDHVVEVPAE
jgi:hypothetical protein